MLDQENKHLILSTDARKYSWSYKDVQGMVEVHIFSAYKK